jgi:hypothetical protein
LVATSKSSSPLAPDFERLITPPKLPNLAFEPESTIITASIPAPTRNATLVANAIAGAKIRTLTGLDREETKSLLEYLARSGLWRGTVDWGTVGEIWALAGNGRVGEVLKKGIGRGM